MSLVFLQSFSKLVQHQYYKEHIFQITFPSQIHSSWLTPTFTVNFSSHFSQTRKRWSPYLQPLSGYPRQRSLFSGWRAFRTESEACQTWCSPGHQCPSLCSTCLEAESSGKALIRLNKYTFMHHITALHTQVNHIPLNLSDLHTNSTSSILKSVQFYV